MTREVAVYTQAVRHSAGTAGDDGVVAPTWVRRAGIVVLTVSVFGAVFPYFSTGVGLPLDGAPDGAMTTWRTVLHLVPGVLGVAAGIGLVDWARRLRRGLSIADPTRTARLGVATGAWFAVGPYVWGLVQPQHAVGTGGLAGAMPDMAGMHMSWISKVMMPMTTGLPPRMTTASCAFTMGVNHWAVGALIILSSLTALGAGAGRGPLAGLAGTRPVVPEPQ